MKKINIVLTSLLISSFSDVYAENTDPFSLKNGCEGNDVSACVTLGLNYYENLDAITAPQALAAFEKACELKDYQSCNAAAQMYLKGDFLETDNDKAASLFKKSCSHNNKDGCLELAKMRLSGLYDGFDLNRAHFFDPESEMAVY